MRLERLHAGSATVNLADPALRTSSNLSSVMQHWNPIAQEVMSKVFLLETADLHDESVHNCGVTAQQSCTLCENATRWHGMWHRSWGICLHALTQVTGRRISPARRSLELGP